MGARYTLSRPHGINAQTQMAQAILRRVHRPPFRRFARCRPFRAKPSPMGANSRIFSVSCKKMTEAETPKDVAEFRSRAKMDRACALATGNDDQATFAEGLWRTRARWSIRLNGAIRTDRAQPRSSDDDVIACPDTAWRLICRRRLATCRVWALLRREFLDGTVRLWPRKAVLCRERINLLLEKLPILPCWAHKCAAAAVAEKSGAGATRWL